MIPVSLLITGNGTYVGTGSLIRDCLTDKYLGTLIIILIPYWWQKTDDQLRNEQRRSFCFSVV